MPRQLFGIRGTAENQEEQKEEEGEEEEEEERENHQRAWCTRTQRDLCDVHAFTSLLRAHIIHTRARTHEHSH